VAGDLGLTPDKMAQLDALDAQGRLTPEVKAALERVRGGVTAPTPETPPTFGQRLGQSFSDVQQMATLPIRWPVSQVTGQLLHSLSQVPQGPAAAFTRPPEGGMMQGAGEAAGQAAGSAAVAPTLAGAALQGTALAPLLAQGSRVPAALQAVGRAARTATSTYPRSLATNIGIGAGAEALTGGDPLMGGALGLIPPAVTALTHGGQTIRELGRSRVTLEKDFARSQVDAARAVQGASLDVPVLAPVLARRSRAQALLLVRDPKVGLARLRQLFRRTEQAISTSGIQTLDLPQLAMATRGQQMIAQGATPQMVQQLLQQGGLLSFAPQEAMDALRQVAALGRNAPYGTLGYAARALDRAVDNEFRQVLTTQGRPDLARLFLQASKDYRKGLGLLRLLEEAKASPGQSQKVMFDADKLRTILIQNIEEYPPSEFPHLWRMLNLNAELGAQSVTRTLGGERVLLPMLAGTGTSVAMPKLQFRNPVGTPPSYAPYSPYPAAIGSAATTGTTVEQLRGRHLPFTPFPR